MDIRVQNILRQIKDSSIEIFTDKLTGIYIHGSLALGCFNWDNSDVDFIVVTKSVPTLQQKKRFIKALLDIDTKAPPKGLEMSLVLEKYTRNFVYPTLFELHFSNAHRSEAINDLEMYCKRMNGSDKDLAAHFTIIRNACITIYGDFEKEIFGEVPASCYLDSIKDDIENAVNEITEDTIYVILNLCRVLAFVKDKIITSKKDGGLWGIEHIPKQYTEIVKSAVNNYLYGERFTYQEDSAFLKEFAKYMLTQIYA